jgi:hypothetical protein
MGAELMPRIRNVCSVAPARQFRPTRGSETPSGLRGASPGAAFRTTSGVGVAIGCKMHRFQTSQTATPRRCSQARRGIPSVRDSGALLPTLLIQQIGDSAIPVVEERVLQGPLPTARIENPMRNLAQSTEITDIEPFSYPACVEEKRFQKLTGVNGFGPTSRHIRRMLRTGQNRTTSGVRVAIGCRRRATSPA